MNIPTSKKELLDLLINGTDRLRREVVDFLSNKKKNKSPEENTYTEENRDTLTKNESIIDVDESIIDVTDEIYKITPVSANSGNKLTDLSNPNLSVPIWTHQYVYSYSEINSATRKQRDFYIHFRNRFLSKEFVDLESNTNYAFILLFDLLNEYENHKNLNKLENQLQNLGEWYPKTKSYAVTFLVEKMEAAGNFEGATRLNNEYQNTYYDYWKLGNKYKTKLSLTDDEVKKLNKLSYSGNNFFNIEYCCFEIIKLYLLTITELENKYNLEKTTMEEQFSSIADVVARKHFRYRLNSQNYKYCIESTSEEIYSIIFKYCENAVREHYGHKRKINAESYYTHPEIKTEFETRIVEKTKEIISKSIQQIALPDEATEIELYAQNTNRWKTKFADLTANYNGDGKQFVADTLLLGKINKKNPSVENIFFEASKFVSKSDKEAALALYIHYLHHDFSSATFDNKQLTKTIQKTLFKTTEQLQDFEAIVSEFFNDKNLEKTLLKVSQIYVPKRKKIQLDTTAIKEVQERHSGTVELLNEFLQDEFEDESNSIASQEINKEIKNQEVKIEITPQVNTPVNSRFISEIAFTPLHQETLELFFKNSLTVSIGELETFVKTKGAFKNQLIDSLNEICFELLDDVLIEEEDEYYTINEHYYQTLLAK